MAVSHVKSDTIADKTGTVTVWDGAGTVTIVASALVLPSNWNSVHNEYYTLSGNTSLSSTASGSNVVLSAITPGPLLTLIGSSDSIVLKTPPFISWFEWPPHLAINIGASTTAFDTTNLSVWPFMLPEAGSFAYFRFPMGGTNSQTNIVVTTGSTANASGQLVSSWSIVLYSQGTGASSKSLVSVASTSAGYSNVNSISVLANGSQWSITNQLIGFLEGVATTWSTSAVSSTVQYIISSGWGTSLSGQRYLDIPFGTSLSAGMYWLAMGYDSTTLTNSTRNYGLTQCFPWSYSSHLMFNSVQSAVLAEFGSTTDSLNQYVGIGLWSTVGGGTASAIALTNITFTNTGQRPYFQLIRQA